MAPISVTTPAYSRAGVDQSLADSAVSALVRELTPLSLSFKSRQMLKSGHFANVIRVADDLGIALSADGVGTKLLVAEELNRFDTIGIDCVAMNVNDLICVGAKPLAMLDYLAVQAANPEREAEIGIGLRVGAERAEIEIAGGELAQLDEVIRGIDLAGACFGSISLNAILKGDEVQAGDAILGLPSAGLHANGYTLARKALKDSRLDEDPDGRLGRPLGEELLEPTTIYVKPIIELLESPVEVHGLAHITSLGFKNLLRLEAEVGYDIDNPLPVPPIFKLIQESRSVDNEEMREVFNLGCGFCCVVPRDAEEAALGLLRCHYPDAQRIGYATDQAGHVGYPTEWPRVG